jgi:hypothetical protein
VQSARRVDHFAIAAGSTLGLCRLCCAHPQDSLSAVFVVVLARRGFGTVTIVIATIIVTVAIAGVALAGVWWLQTQPGRSAARVASDWRLVYQNPFTPDRPCEINAENVYGSGKVCISGGALTDWLHSNQTADQPALDQGPTASGQWYARVDMRVLQGPPDAVCMLMFGYRDPNHWYALRVQGQQPGSQAGSAGVSEFEGAYPGRFYSGPTVERSIDLSSWTSAAIPDQGSSPTGDGNCERKQQRQEPDDRSPVSREASRRDLLDRQRDTPKCR